MTSASLSGEKERSVTPSFTPKEASYKFASVTALSGSSVLKGDDSGALLEIDTNDAQPNSVELCWRQARPFHCAAASAGVVAIRRKPPCGSSERIIGLAQAVNYFPSVQDIGK